MSITVQPAFAGWSPLRPVLLPVLHRRAAPQPLAETASTQTPTTSTPGSLVIEEPEGASALVVALSDELLHQAHDLAQALLATLEDGGRRWRHTRAVAERGGQAAAAVAPGQLNLLLAACWLHDIGYAPAIARTGFHPLDGALHLQRLLWPPALVGLVAHHSGARWMAPLRGLEQLMSPFDRPGYWSGPVADALTWADQTTDPDGRRVSAEERVAEVLHRHGPDSAQARVHAGRGPALQASVRATEQRLSGSAPR